jgi:RNA polymerase sigma-70 factor (ECF subfamily)
MGAESDHPEQVQNWLARLQAGDQAARNELLGHACERLRRLTRKMLKDFARVRRWEQTDDVLQNALVRLWHALREVTPPTARDFYGLAALQIRRELIDLARQYYGPHGLGTNQESQGAADDSATTPHASFDKADTTHEPGGLAAWTEFHQRVDTLPQPEREVFDCLWYHELTRVEAARLLGTSEATVRRLWVAARRRLHQVLGGHLPGT